MVEAISIADYSDDRHYVDVVSIGSTWFFQAIFGAFNLFLFICASLKYGIFITFLSIDDSYYPVLYSLVLLPLDLRASSPSSASRSSSSIR